MADPLGIEAVADLDWDRTQRRGYPEAVYCAEKTAEQVGLIAAAARQRPEVTTLFTRADAAARRGGAAGAARRPARRHRAATGLAAGAARADRRAGRRPGRRHL